VKNRGGENGGVPGGGAQAAPVESLAAVALCIPCLEIVQCGLGVLLAGYDARGRPACAHCMATASRDPVLLTPSEPEGGPPIAPTDKEN
jgi:hypothetical protein